MQLRNLGESDIATTLLKLSALLRTEAIEQPYLTLCSLTRCRLGAVRSFIRNSLFLVLSPSLVPACMDNVESVNQSPGVEVRPIFVREQKIMPKAFPASRSLGWPLQIATITPSTDLSHSLLPDRGIAFR